MIPSVLQNLCAGCQQPHTLVDFALPHSCSHSHDRVVKGTGVRAYTWAAQSTPWVIFVKMVYFKHPSLYLATPFAVRLASVLDLSLWS